jgi:DNA-binding NarL/FixJ family response regulator
VKPRCSRSSRKAERNREIAQLLAISEATVEKHVQRILEKLAVETRAAAAAEYWRARRI